ncbi:Shugoshin-1 like [Quillaja saponaria]|uniref:Shugoshin-1 like n=1 Tax=Quillaja saponaria TaxID=32244 RepID=A0AAD7Q568_QUISA|nr:Shugoshin-1 like [Quillaja saponaria]
MLQENEKGNTSPEVESQKIQRSFEGKPLGRAAEDVHAKELVNKRCCLRRQSARLKSQKKPTEDLILIEASKILVPTLPVDLVRENCPKLLEGTVQEENGGGTSAKSESQEIWKSYKRPLRQAAEKVQSYKEISINVKMRRPE